MCSIFGLGFQKGNKIKDKKVVSEIVNRLFIESVSRGRNASGAVFCTNKSMKVYKDKVSGNLLINQSKFKETLSEFLKSFEEGKKSIPLSILGHCRATTKGTENNNLNNHPIVRRDVIGIHNGHISNDDKVFRQYSGVMKRNGQVDSEIIFALIEKYSEGRIPKPISKAIYKMSTELIGGMACSMLHKKHPYAVWIFRNHNPCSIVRFKDVGLIVWASIEEFITEATRGLPLGTAETIEISTDQSVELDLHRNMIHRFELSKRRYKYAKFH